MSVNTLLATTSVNVYIILFRFYLEFTKTRVIIKTKLQINTKLINIKFEGR